MFSIIVAKDKNNNIGYNGDLLFHYKKDMERFKSITSETNKKDKINAVIMGRKTYYSIPNKFRPLKNRINIVMSMNSDNVNKLKLEIIENNYNNVIIKSNIEEVLNYIKNNKNIENTYIIGGSQIYDLFLNYNIINNLYITTVDREFTGDTQINITNLNNYNLVECIDIHDKNILETGLVSEDLLTFSYYTYNNKEENNYLKSIKYILTKGLDRKDRTNIGTKSVFGQSFRYNVRNGMLPLFTTKRVFFRGIVEELLWFISGSTDVKKLQDKNIHIWDGNSTREFLDNRGLHHLREGDIGACFPADTMVLTNNGYKKIQNVKLTDKLYTHKGNWYSINNTQKSKFTGKLYKFRIKYFNNLIECTDNHPFLIKNGEYTEWKRADELLLTDLVGIKKNTNNSIPSFKNSTNKDMWFILGYMCNLNITTDTIIVKNLKSKYIISRFQSIIKNVEIDIYNNFIKFDKINIPIIDEFKNNIPEFLQDLPKDYIEEFLDGYYLSNWFINNNKYYVYTKSYSDSLNIQRLYLKIDKYITINNNNYRISNTAFNTESSDYIWFPINDIYIENVINLDIYNFEVDTDNTYTVQNIAVHNSYGHQLRHFNAPYINCETDYTNQGIDQIKYVLDLIKTNPHSRRILFSYWNPQQLNETALPSCFPKDTLVLTNNGYKEIQFVSIFDKVLSHTGRWNRVLNIQNRVYNDKLYIFDVLYNNKPIICTKEHPFYIRDIINITDGDVALSKPYWCKAENIIKGKHVLCFPVNKLEKVPIINNFALIDKYHWVFMGYYLKNGYISCYDNISHLTIKKTHSHILYIINTLDIEYSIISNKGDTIEIEMYDKKWYNILIDFGNLEFNKKIPEWVQDAPKNLIIEFIKGYNYGNNIKHKIEYNTKIYNVAYGLQRLYFKLKKLLVINYTISEHNIYNYQLYLENNIDIFTNNYVNFPINNITQVNDNLDVYNFEVENDSSYIVNNITVHNCHIMYTFYVDTENNEISLKFDQRSCDTFHGLPFNIASAAILLNMVCYLTKYQPGDIFHTISDMHIYSSHFYECDKLISRKPTIFPKLKINPSGKTINSIDDFTFEDFELINYYPQSSIKAPMVI